MSADELRSLFSQWKNNGRQLRMSLWQAGHTSLWAVLSDWEVTDTEVSFSFGFAKLASGELVIPLSELLTISVPDLSAPRPLDPIDPPFESCIEFSWKLLGPSRERCLVSVQRRI
jgi:hypothetical protein